MKIENRFIDYALITTSSAAAGAIGGPLGATGGATAGLIICGTKEFIHFVSDPKPSHAFQTAEKIAEMAAVIFGPIASAVLVGATLTFKAAFVTGAAFLLLFLAMNVILHKAWPERLNNMIKKGI